MKDYIIMLIVFGSCISILTTLVMVDAQIISIDKTFIRCNIDTSLLDSMDLSYDKHCNEEYIIVHNWQDISVSNQTTITIDMNSKGFTEQVIPIQDNVTEAS